MGCIPGPVEIGQRFGRWTVVSEILRVRGRPRRYCTQCDCGSAGEVYDTDLRNGNSQSCGCRKKEILTNAVHGACFNGVVTAEYSSWAGMINRCTSANNKAFHRYGGRGISVCWQWVHGDGDRTGYECFVADMGLKPTPKHSIDRINNDGNYEATNCRWATAKEQMANRSHPSTWKRAKGRKGATDELEKRAEDR